MTDKPTDTLLLFTSAPPDRPQYTLDFLTCLASPNGHRVTFSYKREWLADDVYRADLVDRRALVIFCESDENAKDMWFLPLRWATIRSFGPDEIVKEDLAQPETRLALTFELDRFVYASPDTIDALTEKTTTTLRKLAIRPYRRGDGGASSKWAIFDRFTESGTKVKPQTAWPAHAQKLSRQNSLKEALLFQVSCPQFRWFGQTKELRIESDELLGSAYKLRARRQYKLDVSFYLRQGDDPKDLVRADVSSDRIRRTAPITASLGEETVATIFFSSEALASDELATVTVQGPENLPSTSTPTVAFIVRVRPTWGTMIVGGALIVAGVFFGGLSESEWNKVASGLSFRQLLAIKFGAALLVAIGAFVAFRRQPSGS